MRRNRAKSVLDMVALYVYISKIDLFQHTLFFVPLQV